MGGSEEDQFGGRRKRGREAGRELGRQRGGVETLQGVCDKYHKVHRCPKLMGLLTTP